VAANGSVSYTPEEVYERFVARFKGFTDEELIGAFNRDVGNPGWVSARASYHVALHREFKLRGFDCSAMAEFGWSLRSKIKLIGNVVLPLADVDAKPSRKEPRRTRRGPGKST
jgi:hypothetical protein